MKITNVKELNEALRNGHYDTVYIRPEFLREGTVIDEEKSVRWNREEVERRNKVMREKIEENRRERREKGRQQNEDIIRAYANDSGLTEEQVGKIYSYAYTQYHSSGINEVINRLNELIYLVIDVVIDVIEK